MQTKEYFIQLTRNELAGTLRAIRAVPTESDSYAPDQKARTARKIVGHIIGHPLDLIEGIETGVINHRNQSEFGTYEEAATSFETDTNRLIEMVGALDEKTWDEKQADFAIGGMTLYAKSLRDHCYTLHADTIHHRGQLSTYYRSMGVRNPVIYGATAETAEDRAAAAKAASAVAA
ncbi:MAG: DinB family protein [bacterium]